jgi:hypothetical protein
VVSFGEMSFLIETPQSINRKFLISYTYGIVLLFFLDKMIQIVRQVVVVWENYTCIFLGRLAPRPQNQDSPPMVAIRLDEHVTVMMLVTPTQGSAYHASSDISAIRR